MPSADFVSHSATIIPPVMGLNTKDPLSRMGPEYAIDCLNFFSDGSSVDLRTGYRYFAKAIGSGVTLPLGELALQNGTRKLLAEGDNRRPYDVSAGGNGVDLSNAGTFLISSPGPGLSVNFRNKIFIKGLGNTDDVVYWDGATASVTAAGFTGPGGDDKELFNPNVYKNRLYFVGRNSLSIWYADLNAITGTLTEFDMQSVFTLGGSLFYCGSTTKQGAIDENYFVAISDQGEVLLYAGDYPGNVASWRLIGKYYMPPPVGERSFFNWGANLVIITYEGVCLLSAVLAGGNDLVFLTENISAAFKAELQSGSASRYWTGIYYPTGRWLLINTYNNKQFVMNTITGGWWVWDIPSFGWSLYSNNIYFGSSDAQIYKANTGYFDETGSAGAMVTRSISLQPAFNYFGDPEGFKQFTFVIPTVYQSNTLSLIIDCDVDYEDTVATSVNTDATKGSTYQIYQPRCGLQGIGKAASIRIDGTVTDKQMSVQVFEVFWTPGDIA